MTFRSRSALQRPALQAPSWFGSKGPWRSINGVEVATVSPPLQRYAIEHLLGGR
jgi:hypothetical protein